MAGELLERDAERAVLASAVKRLATSAPAAAMFGLPDRGVPLLSEQAHEPTVRSVKNH